MARRRHLLDRRHEDRRNQHRAASPCQFWNQLFDGIRAYGDSAGVLMRERMRREMTYAEAQDRIIGGDWNWQEQNRDGQRRVPGFNIGEAIVDLPGRSRHRMSQSPQRRPDRLDACARMQSRIGKRRPREGGVIDARRSPRRWQAP